MPSPLPAGQPTVRVVRVRATLPDFHSAFDSSLISDMHGPVKEAPDT